MDLQAGDPLVNGLEEDGDGGDDNECAFKSGREKSDALVAVEEVVGGRAQT